MNLHITPSFNIDRLCKTASVLLFLVTIIEITTETHFSQLRQGIIYSQINSLPQLYFK